jgi:hypothetical protein
METRDARDAKQITERVFTIAELADEKKVHPKTIQRYFLDEPGVLRFGTAGGRGHKQRFILRIPESVVARVFGRMTVGAGR